MLNAKIALSIAGVAGVIAAAALLTPEPPEAVAQRGMQDAEMRSYAIDPVHTSVVFKVGHLGASNFYGTFEEKSGTFEMDPATGELRAVDITIQTGSVDTDNSSRDDHIKSTDFFNTRQYPTIRFVSTNVTHNGGKSYTLSGDLTMYGNTGAIEADVEFIGTAEFRGTNKVGFDASFIFDRTEWGLNAWDGLVGNDITIMVGVEGDEQ